MGGGVTESAAIYEGEVVHRRARPKRHKLRYKVFSLLVDLDRLAETDKSLRLFSVDRFNLFSLYRKDFAGHESGDDPAAFIRRKAAALGLEGKVERVRMLAYPRILGYAFNPLTVYFLEDAAGQTLMVVHEVHNTFGEHHFYQAEAGAADAAGALTHSAKKAFYVSPFNTLEGSYRFAIRPPDEEVFVGIVLSGEQGPILSAHFKAKRRKLNDGALLRLALAYPFMTTKVLVGIHWEALRLWLKGLPLTLGLRRMQGSIGAARR